MATRRLGSWFLACTVCLSIVGFGAVSAPAAPGNLVQALIAQAGNADDDRDRLQIVRRLRDTPGLDAALKRDAEQMIAAVERWLDTSNLDYFGGEIHRTLEYDFHIAPSSPLYPWLQQPAEDAAPGSEAWCAGRLSLLAETLAKYRRLTGSAEFDELLRREEAGAVLLDPAREREAVVAALRQSAEALCVNFEGYTSEVRYTDRVLRFPALFGRDMMFAEPVARIRTPNPQLLYTLATGDPGDCGYMPLAAVRWLTPPRDIAAMVTDVGTDRFRAELFHFGAASRPMAAELYLLAPGRYTCELRGPDGAPVGRPFALTVTGARTRVEFELPPRRACVLCVTRR